MAAPNPESIKKTWNLFARNYALYVAPVTRPTLFTLVSSLQLERCKKGLLEMGVGPGTDLAHVRGLLPTAAKYVATDYSENMVEIAAANAPKGVVVQVADGQSTPQFGDGAFDRYLANLCLMSVPDTNAMLREAHRVLDVGGIACFSVWGRPELSPLQTLVPAVTKELTGKGESNVRSEFHLGSDDAALRARVLAAGFATCVVWHQPTVMPVLTGHDFAERHMLLGVPSAEEERKVLGDSFDRVFAEVARRADEILARGEPIAMDTAIVVAQK